MEQRSPKQQMATLTDFIMPSLPTQAMTFILRDLHLGRSVDLTIARQILMDFRKQSKGVTWHWPSLRCRRPGCEIFNNRSGRSGIICYKHWMGGLPTTGDI